MDQQLQTPMSGDNLAGRAVPAARPLSDFCMERIGDEVVLFDSALNRYHTLNGFAFDIWRSCDGVHTMEQITNAASERGVDARREVVEAAVTQLGEAGLLDAPESDFESTMHRRRMMKLVAAGAVGAVGIPVVASITRLGPEASATHGNCRPPGDTCNVNNPGQCCSHICNPTERCG